jgi:predicted kinase
MVKVFVFMGIPASGKSTEARKLVHQGRGTWKRVNKDEIRAMIDNGVYSLENETIVKRVRDLIIQQSVKRGINVIVDDTNIRDKGRNFDEICSIVEPLGLDVQVIEKPFYVDVNEAIKRDAAREKPWGEKIVRTYWHDSGGKSFQWYKPKVETYLASAKGNRKQVKYVPGLPDAVMCDLDGTLALIGERNVYDADECDIKDAINEPVADVVKLYAQSGRHIIFCSGRIEKYREPTIRFIGKHLPGLEYELFMRKDGDKRKDAIVKNELYRNHIEGKFNVLFVLDDRDQVVEEWRRIGIPCFQVAPGNF